MITAKCINNRQLWPEKELSLEVSKSYEVDHIDMGQSFTFVHLKGLEEWFNSLCFEFYEDDKPLDIYKDKRFNPYI